MGTRARSLHMKGNRLTLTDGSHAFNTVNKKVMLAVVNTCEPVPTLFYVQVLQ